MKILEFSDWLIMANDEASAFFSQEELSEHCTCPWCRNFYATVDEHYPQLRPFLAQFGQDIEAPESLMPIAGSLYQVSYVCEGKILRSGAEPIFLGELVVSPEPCEEDAFYLHIGLMKLPWVLMEDVKTVPLPEVARELFRIPTEENGPRSIL